MDINTMLNFAGGAAQTAQAFTGGGGTAGSDAYWSVAPMYEHSEEAQDLGATTRMDILNQINAGQVPWFIQEQLDNSRNQAMNAQDNLFFGSAGNRPQSQTLFDAAMQAGQQMGGGNMQGYNPNDPYNGANPYQNYYMNQTQRSYDEMSKQIDEILQLQGVRAAGQNYYNTMQGINSMQLGPMSQFVPATAGTTNEMDFSGLAQMGGAALKMWNNRSPSQSDVSSSLSNSINSDNSIYETGLRQHNNNSWANPSNPYYSSSMDNFGGY